MPPRRRAHYSWDESPPPRRPVNRCRTLLIIDNRPLQDAAWGELLRARKRLEKAASDVHRHEETDEPAFRAWLANTFPTLISAARELAQQLDAKLRIVQAVETEAFVTGRDAGQIWREWQRSGGRPSEDNARNAARPEEPPDLEDIFEEEMKRVFAEAGGNGETAFADDLGGGSRDRPDATDARATYRRLVQHLHPDRGGEWTVARARVWEQVQGAWAARDADWLARLEAEWEASADLLGPTSAIGKLRAALAEIDAARRDAEKRVREYRKRPAWRFSLKTPSVALRTSLERQLRHDATMFRSQLDNIEAIIASWKNKPVRRSSRGRRRHAEYWEFEL
jgi:hypothetical protein